jgi:hypothetical protein
MADWARSKTGQFVSGDERWRQIQTAAVQGDDTPKQALKQLEEVNRQIKELQTNGLRLKG